MDRILDYNLRSMGNESSDNSNVYLERKQDGMVDDLVYKGHISYGIVGIDDALVGFHIKHP